MMNLIKLQNQLKDLSDRQLAEQMQTGGSPQFLVLSEMQRRQKMRQAAGAANEAPQTTVAEEIGHAAMPPMQEQGIAALPMEPPAFADGGIVSFASGGEPKATKSKRYKQPAQKPQVAQKPQAQKPDGPVRNSKGETIQQVLKRLGVPSYYAEFPITDELGVVGWDVGNRGSEIGGARVDISTRIQAEPELFDELRPFAIAPTETDVKHGRASTEPKAGQPPASPASSVVPTIAPPPTDERIQVVPRAAQAADTELSAPGARASSAPAASSAAAGLASLISGVGGQRGVEGGAGDGMGPELSAPGARASSAPAASSAAAGLASLISGVGGQRGVEGVAGAGMGPELSAPPGARASSAPAASSAAGLASLISGGGSPRGVEGVAGAGRGPELSAPPGARASSAKAAPPAGLASLISGVGSPREVESGAGARGGPELSNAEVYADATNMNEPQAILMSSPPRSNVMFEIPGVLPPGSYTEEQLKAILGDRYDPRTASPLQFSEGGSTWYKPWTWGSGSTPPKSDAPVETELSAFGSNTWDQRSAKRGGGWEQRGTGRVLDDEQYKALQSRFSVTRPQNLAEVYKGVGHNDPAAYPAASSDGIPLHYYIPGNGAPTGHDSNGRAHWMPLAFNKNARTPMTNAQIAAATPPAPTPAVTPRANFNTPTAKPPAVVNATTTPTVTVAPLVGAAKDYESLLLGLPEPTYNTDKETALLKKLQGKVDARKDEPFNMALMQAGLSMMAGTSPHAMVNMGAGGIQGLKAYAEGKKDLRDLEKEITNAELSMEKAAKDNDWKVYESNAERLSALYTMRHQADTLTEQGRHNKATEAAAKIQAEAAKTAANRPLAGADDLSQSGKILTQIGKLTTLRDSATDKSTRDQYDAEIKTLRTAYTALTGTGGAGAEAGRGAIVEGRYVPPTK